MHAVVLRRLLVGTITSKGLQRTPREFLFQISVALIAGDQLAQDFAYAAMAARELDHAFGKRRAPEVSVGNALRIPGVVGYMRKKAED